MSSPVRTVVHVWARGLDTDPATGRSITGLHASTPPSPLYTRAGGLDVTNLPSQTGIQGVMVDARC